MVWLPEYSNVRAPTISVFVQHFNVGTETGGGGAAGRNINNLVSIICSFDNFCRGHFLEGPFLFLLHRISSANKPNAIILPQKKVLFVKNYDQNDFAELRNDDSIPAPYSLGRMSGKSK